MNYTDNCLVHIYNLYTNDALAEWFKLVVFSKIFIGLHNNNLHTLLWIHTLIYNYLLVTQYTFAYISVCI